MALLVEIVGRPRSGKFRATLDLSTTMHGILGLEPWIIESPRLCQLASLPLDEQYEHLLNHWTGKSHEITQVLDESKVDVVLCKNYVATLSQIAARNSNCDDRHQQLPKPDILIVVGEVEQPDIDPGQSWFHINHEHDLQNVIDAIYDRLKQVA
jgi:hypothetical protein